MRFNKMTFTINAPDGKGTKKWAVFMSQGEYATLLFCSNKFDIINDSIIEGHIHLPEKGILSSTEKFDLEILEGGNDLVEIAKLRKIFSDGIFKTTLYFLDTLRIDKDGDDKKEFHFDLSHLYYRLKTLSFIQ